MATVCTICAFQSTFCNLQSINPNVNPIHFISDAYVGVLVACPTLALAEVLIQPYGMSTTPVLPVGTVVSELLKTESHQVGVKLLEQIHANILSGELFVVSAISEHAAREELSHSIL